MSASPPTADMISHHSIEALSGERLALRPATMASRLIARRPLLGLKLRHSETCGLPSLSTIAIDDGATVAAVFGTVGNVTAPPWVIAEIAGRRLRYKFRPHQRHLERTLLDRMQCRHGQRDHNVDLV